MNTAQPIKYVLIGDSKTSQRICEFAVVKSPQTQTEATQIFEKLSKAPEKKHEERNKIQGKQGNYYFIISGENSVFFLALADASYPERLVFQMFDEINKDHIPLMVNEKNELNANGRQILKTIIDKYQDDRDLNKIGSIRSDVGDIKLDMGQNIKKMMVNIDDIQNLESQSNRIKSGAVDYKKNARELERVTWWQNCKLTIIIAVIVIAVILAIVLPLTLHN